MDNKRKNNNIETKMTDICISVIDKTTAPLVGPDFTLIHEGTNAVAQPLDFGSSTRQSVLSGANLDKNDIISKLIAIKKETKNLDNNSFLFKIGECFPEEQKREKDKKRVFVSKYQPICIETEEKIIIIRASDHNAVCDNLLERNYTYGKGIVVKPKNSKNTFKDNDNVNFKEYVFFATDNSENKYNKIIDGLVSLIKTGEWDEKVKYDNMNISPKIVVKSDNNTDDNNLDGTLGAIQTPDTYDDIFIRNFNSVSSAFDKEIDNELSDEELLAKYSWLPNNAKRKKLWAADTSKNLKTFLSYYFPGVKFSVSKDRYGDISVNYDDDICGFLVSGIIAKFNGKSWDGMYDEHHYHSSNFIKLFADGFSSISCYKNWDSQTERNFLNDAKDIDRLLEKYPLLIPTKDKEVYEKILKALKEALAQKSIPRHLEKYLDLRRVNPYKQRSPKPPKPSKEVVVKNPNPNSEFEIVDYSEKSIVLIGDTKPYKDLLGRSGIGGTYNSHLNTDKVPGGEGWVFSKKKQQEVEDFVKKYGKSSENKDEKYLHKLFIEIICGLNNKTLSLQGIPTKGISTNPFQKNDILKLKGEMYDGTLYKVVSANTNQITTKVISGNCQTIEPFTKEYFSTLEKAKLQHLDICEEH